MRGMKASSHGTISKSATRIVVVGSSNTDLVVYSDQLPAPGETLLGGRFSQSHGGKGANQAVAAARAGAKVVFVGGHGKDDFGSNAKKTLSMEGIDVAHFKQVNGTNSGIALIMVGGRQRQNIIVVAESANDKLTANDIRRALPQMRKAKAVLTQLETPMEAVLATAALAGQLKVPCILNPAPARKLPRDLYKKLYAITPNEHEARVLTGISDPRSAGRALNKMGCPNVVVTLGDKGALVVNADGANVYPAPKVKPVDTVGAGDCFSGWLTVGIAQGLSIHDAVKQAIKAASISVTRYGAQSSMPYKRELKG
jgi:ribokinase